MRENLLNLSTTPRSAVLIVKNEPNSKAKQINAKTITRKRIMNVAGLSMALSYPAGMSSHRKASEIKAVAA
jgi:hypothetical protein